MASVLKGKIMSLYIPSPTSPFSRTTTISIFKSNLQNLCMYLSSGNNAQTIKPIMNFKNLLHL